MWAFEDAYTIQTPIQSRRLINVLKVSELVEIPAFVLCAFSVKVKSWLKGRGLESLSSKQDIGESLAAVEVLWQQYEKIESKAQVCNPIIRTFLYKMHLFRVSMIT